MSDILFFTSKTAFAQWLEAHPHATELWVGYYKKAASQHSLTWSETVDVALCYGWIDGIRKTIDGDSFKIRFTPRRANSVWSAVNVKKAEQLIKDGAMKPAGLRLFQARSDTKGYASDDRNVPLAPAYEAKIKANVAAWTYFDALAPSYKRDSIWWVMSAKREDTRLRRLGVLIDSSEAQQKIPMLRKKP